MPSINDGVLLEFLNQNMHRNYPIYDNCVPRTTDNVYLPSSFLVDCKIIIPCDTEQMNQIDTSRFFVSDVVFYTNSVQVLIGYQPDGDSAYVCASSSAIVLSDNPDQPYPAEIVLGPSGNPPDGSPLKNLSGKLWIGSTANMVNLGSLHFEYDNTKLSSSCIYKTPMSPVSSIRVLDSAGSVVAVLSGEVTIQASTGLLVSFDEGVLSIGIDTAWLDDEINGMIDDSGSFIKTINGQRPDSTGNFVIAGIDCLTVSDNDNSSSLTVSNTCSKPCCGDESGDIADIRSAQDLLKDKMNRISSNLNTFINSINNVETRLPSLVASRK